MQNTCPKCNRPVRPGAKFCGFCGTTLTPARLVASPQPAKNNGAANCPHCNAPLRAGVKFCANCGKPVSDQKANGQAAGQAAVQASGPVQPISPPPVAPPAPPRPAPEPTGRISTARGRRARRSRGRYIIYLVVLFVICLALAIPAVLLGGPLVQEWLVKTTPTSTVTETSLPVPTNTNTPEPTATSTSTSTATVTPSATPTQTQIPTQTARPTQVLRPTYTSTPVAPLLEEDFDNALSEQWELWGNTDNITTTLIIEGNDSDTFLLLSSQDVTADGISSLAEDIPLEPGVMISFTANLTTPAINTDLPTLRFAWTPGTVTPLDLDPDEPLALELLIQPTSFNLTIILEDNTQGACTAELEAGTHTFRIEVSETTEPKIFVDEQPVCEDMTIFIQPFSQPGGRIHFSGSGLVDDIMVYLQPFD